MKLNRLLSVLLLTEMAMPACAQDDSGLWAMLEQLETLSDVLLLGQDALPGAAVPGENQKRSSPDNAIGAGSNPEIIVGSTFGTRAGLGSDAHALDTGKARLRKAAQAARPAHWPGIDS
jgi:hypothetical protein